MEGIDGQQAAPERKVGLLLGRVRRGGAQALPGDDNEHEHADQDRGHHAQYVADELVPSLPRVLREPRPARRAPAVRLIAPPRDSSSPPRQSAMLDVLAHNAGAST